MHRSLLVLAIASAASGVLLLAPFPLEGQRASRLERQTVNGREVVAREVLVKFRNTLQPPEFAEVARETDAEDVKRIGRAGTIRLRSKSLSAAALLAMLARREDVVYAEPNFIIHIAAAPNDPGLPELWGFDNIHAIPAWDLSVGSASNVVAVIDTGIDYTHEDLAANMWSAPASFTVDVGGQSITCAAGTHGFNAITRTCNPMDDHSHGTHVSGTIGAVGNNGIGVVGVNWTTRLMGIKFLDAQGSGTTADAIAAVEFAVAAKQALAATGGANVRVLSNSWGGPEFSQALLDAVNAANDADILFVAGAGNDGFDNDILPFYPASFDAPNIISVAATGYFGDLSWFSNYGALSVHLGAPGEDILSTMIGNNYDYASGTSMATPHVSGAAVLVLSYCDLSTAALKDTLLGSVDPLPAIADATVSGGRLNVNNALYACTAPPEAPASLAARGADTKVTLSWAGAPGALRYNLKRSLTPGGPYSPLASAVKGTGYIDTGVVNGTPYYYVVSAENTLGESGDSNEASATPNIPPDVLVSTFTVPAVASADSTVVVSVTTKNQGAGRAQPSTTRVHLSANSSLDASDLVLTGEQAVPELAAGAVMTASVTIVIPAGVSVGRHYLIANADDDDVLDESSDTNNHAARQVLIGPDLLISSLTSPAAGAAGGTIAVADTVKNQGGGSAAGSSTAFYLSANSTIGTGDVVLAATRNVPGLAAGATSVGTTVLTIPTATLEGTYYIVAKADGNDGVAETAETNNTFARVILIGSDLAVTSLTVPGNGAVDSTIGGAAAASVTRFYLSANSTLDGADILLAVGRDVAALAPGISSSGSTTVVIPPPTLPGAYYIVAKADGDNRVPETAESNNTFARAILIGADLVVAATTAPANGRAGASIIVSHTIGNQGGGPATASTTRFYLSANSAWDTGDVLLAEADPVPQLAAGATDAGSTSLTIPPATAPGRYYVIARADADHVVLEANEANNAFPRTIQIGSDVVVSTLSTPVAKAAAGSSIVVSETVTNQGGDDATASVVRFYLSANVTLDAGDLLMDGSRTLPDLLAGASSAGSTSVIIPPGNAAGSFYIIAKADADNTIAEALETNNTRFLLIGIGPDLIISTVSVSFASVPAGAVVNLTDTVVNQGAQTAAPTITRFYLSKNGVIDSGDVAFAPGRSIADLAVGASSSGTTPVTIPPGTAPGTYYVLAKADGGGVVAESLETNNVMARALQVTLGP
jgi:subtilase family serine protease